MWTTTGRWMIFSQSPAPRHQPHARGEHAGNTSVLDPPATSWQNIWMIHLRDARQNELPSLSALCLRSKAVWGYDDAFMIACRTELTLVPDELKSTHVQVAERGTMVAGLAQVKVTDADAHLLKLFVEPALLRSGVVSLLFEWARARARSLGAVRLVATYLAGFREATKTPVSTSAKPMMWNSCGRSPRKTMAIADPNTGTT